VSLHCRSLRRALLLGLPILGLFGCEQEPSGGGAGASEAPRPDPVPDPDGDGSGQTGKGSAAEPEEPAADGSEAPGDDADHDHQEPAPGASDDVDVDDEAPSSGLGVPEAADGLVPVVVDLSDDWAPHAFAKAPELGEVGAQPYRETLLALADERPAETEDGEPIEGERYLELFGIFPTFRVLRERLLDEDAHACHAAVDDGQGADLTELSGALTAADLPGQRRRRKEVRFIRAKLAAEVRAKEVTGVAALRAEHGAELARFFRRLDELAPEVDAIRAAQGHLVCDGLLADGRFESGVLDPETRTALADWQRRHFLISNGILDEPTRETLALDSRELDYRAVLRSLRERVVDALGILEDGSARGERPQVLGRVLDPRPMRPARAPGDDDPKVASIPGAPDLVSAATEAAAVALGWRDPAGTAADLRRRPDFIERRATLPLPPVPDWYSDDLDLRGIIDRGDVWYDPPYDYQGRRRRQPIRRRPSFRLVVDHDGERVALVRWATTIGGWKREDAGPGGVRMAYKSSPPGERIWRDLIVSPAWLPPRATPDDELVRRDPRTGRWVPNHSLFGPSYRSAYGLAMLVHHRRAGDAAAGSVADEDLIDEGIRTHGSVSYQSIVGGTSHGCHRLFNHLAVRLAGFLLRHRPHERHGSMSVRYERAVRRAGRDVRFRMSTRGVRFELTPPVPVEVLEGRIRGNRQTPYPGFYPLAKTLRE